jgi:hypothetical protein
MDHFYCDCCHGGSDDEKIKAIKKKMREDIKKFGFVIHFVEGAHPEFPGFINFHTHGIEKSQKHPNFQIVIGVSDVVAHKIFWELFRKVEKGTKFKPGKDYEGIIDGFPVRFFKVKETGEEVLRVIFPDKDGRFPGDRGVNDDFGLQHVAKVEPIG